MPYRERAERPKIPAEGRRWFTKHDDVEKGPFEEEALVRAVQSNKLKSSTLVRPEDESEWRPLSHVKQLMPKATRARADFDPARDLAAEAHGSFNSGLVAGMLGGCIGLLLVEVLAKHQETKRGARIGFFVQLFVGVMIRVWVMMDVPH